MARDILLVMSDQHNGRYTSRNQAMEDLTPNLSRIEKDGGCAFDRAYCNSPLCVPSRMSFLRGELPSDTLIFENDTTLNSDRITLAHEMALAGYETILVGRMHFMGMDQFHGFDRRLVGDITNRWWGMTREELGSFHRGFGSSGCQEMVGRGETAITDYDRTVFETAMRILEDPADRPRFVVVGFYQPHYPYVSLPEDISVTSSVGEAEVEMEPLAGYAACRRKTTVARARDINCAYKKMVHTIDRYVGQLYDLFREKSDGLFVYTSDHGDQLGKRSIYGKRTLYEDSIRVPLVLNGVDLSSTDAPVDLLALHDLLLAYARGEECLVAERPVVVQSLLENEGLPFLAEAVLAGNYKLVRLGNETHLYDIDADPEETRDLLEGLEAVASKLSEKLLSDEELESCLGFVNVHRGEADLLRAVGRERHMNYFTDYAVESPFVPAASYDYEIGSE